MNRANDMESEKNWSASEVDGLYEKLRPEVTLNQGKHVVIGDADENTRSILSAQLQKKGFSVWAASNSLDTIKYIKKRSPDCCILDMNLKPISGIDILEAMNRDDMAKDICIFVCTTAKNSKDRIISRIYGARDYLKKPIKGSELAEEINNFLKIRNT